MTIRECLQKDLSNTTTKKYAVVNIGFVNISGSTDETQLNITHDLKSEEGIFELSELFESLCKEFETTADSVCYVELIMTTDSITELENY